MKPLSKTLSSAQSTNVKAGIWGCAAVIAPTIAAMPDGWERTWLISLFCVMMTVVNWRTQGSGLDPDEGERIQEILNNPDLQEVLRDGRK